MGRISLNPSRGSGQGLSLWVMVSPILTSAEDFMLAMM